MRKAIWAIGIAGLLPWAATAGEESKKDFSDFSRLLHKMVLRQLPKEFEDTSAWGQTIPAPPKLSLPALRKFVKVGDKLEVPHGAWRRFKGRIEDPDKNLKITVKDFSKRDQKGYRLVADVEATIFCQGEWQQWQKGLLLIGGVASADADLKAAIVCDVDVLLNIKKFPPELIVEPKVTSLGLELVNIRLRDSPIVIKGEKADALGNNLKDLLRAAVKASEPVVKDKINQAIADSLKEGKGTISAAAIMKAPPAPKK